MTRFIDTANRLEKSLLYETYFRLFFEESKNYESITRKKIAECLIKKYSSEYIAQLCTSRELKYLQNLLENKPLENEESCLFEKEALREKQIVFCNEIWDEFKEPVQKAIDMVDWKKKEKEDQILVYLIGLIKAGGIVDVMLVEAIAKAICENDEKKSSTILESHPMFQYYTIFTDQYRNEKGRQCPVFIHYDSFDQIDYITQKRNDYTFVTPKFYEQDTYTSFFYNDYDETNPEIKDFFKLLQKDIRYEYYKIVFLAQSQFLLEDDFVEREMIPRKYTEVWKKIKDLMPSPILRGMCPKDYQEAVEKSIKMNNLNNLNQTQVNATLSQKETKMFYTYFFSVLDFTNKKYRIDPSLVIKSGLPLEPERMTNVIDKFWENKEIILNEYIRFNPLKLNRRALKQIDAFRNGIRDTFILYRYEKKNSIFILDNKVYMVKGLYDNLDRMVSARQLPVPIHTTILPFENKIVIDGIVSPIPVVIGPNQIEQLEKIFQENKRIYSLDPKH